MIRFVILAYRLLLSPFLGHHCRFTPSCSQYALTVIEQFSLFTALRLIIKRISHCHPWHPGGCDEPPLPS